MENEHQADVEGLDEVMIRADLQLRRSMSLDLNLPGSRSWLLVQHLETPVSSSSS